MKKTDLFRSLFFFIELVYDQISEKYLIVLTIWLV